MQHADDTEVLGAAHVWNARTGTKGTGLRDLLWFRLDFGRGRTSPSSANNTLHLAVVTVVAYLVWRSTQLEVTIKSWFV
jgi:hypothetical protein